jgi:hypothetical protein
MRGRFSESEPVETPPHPAEYWYSLDPCCPLPARGARGVVVLGDRWRHGSKFKGGALK